VKAPIQQNMTRHLTDIAIVGGGPAGLAAALAAATTGTRVALIAPQVPGKGLSGDLRTAALFAGSIDFLKNLGVWDACAPFSAPITGIRIVDDTGNLLRAPEVHFKSCELGLAAFGYNVPNATLVSALEARVEGCSHAIERFWGATAAAVEVSSLSAVIRLADGRTIEAKLIAGADGRNSLCRKAAGIATTTWTYPQSAVVCSFDHSRAHNSVSTELHRPHGPCTTVPLPGLRSSLVWVESTDEASRLASLDDQKFRFEIERRLQGLLGTIGGLTPRACFPLSGLSAKALGANRVALIGEAGHVIPPIGAQGLNLGMRDAATLADCVEGAIRSEQDPGSEDIVQRYASARSGDVKMRITGIDYLNRSLLADVLPIHLVRGLGLYTLSTIGPLRRYIVREGLQPSSALPTLMRPPGDTRPASA
jgi:2-octaprenyl-6-methoxyphenol hydroxylase